MIKILVFIFVLTSTFSFNQEIKRIGNQGNYNQKHSSYSFLENKGQWDKDVLFKSTFKGGNLWVQRKKIFFQLKDYSDLHNSHANPNFSKKEIEFKQHAVHLNFKNAKEISRITKSEPSKEFYNFFIGKDKEKWATDVHSYTSAVLHEIYTGIDLKLIQNDEELKYEFHLQANANPTQIQLEIAGANRIFITNEKELQIETPLGIIKEKKPYTYQIIDNQEHEIKSEFYITDNIVTFKLGNYDPNLPLVIDPVLIFATYSGSVTDNFGMTATYGYDGSAYSGGTIFGNSYPTPDNGAYNITSNFTLVDVKDAASDVFISKYAADGSQMIWTNFIGGGNNTDGAETVHSLICDKQNNLYAFGATSSTDFPITTGAFQATHNGGSKFIAKFNGAKFGDSGVDIFTIKLSSNGTQLLGSTYIGGSGNDGVNGNLNGINNDYNGTQYYDSLTSNYGDQFRGEIMLDSLNNILIATSTRSSDFPTKNALQTTIGGQQDGVIFQLKNDFSELLFSTFLGGQDNDALYSVKIDSSYNIVFCGGTSSTNLPTTPSAYQKNYGGGKTDGIIGKLNSDGTILKYLTYVGLSKYDQTFIVEIDDQDRVYTVGHSIGGSFPVLNATYSVANSTQFIAQLDSTLSNLLRSTVYGNGNANATNISPAAMLVDNCGNVYVSGWGANILQGTPLNGMPISSDGLMQTPPNGFDFHLFAIDKDFSKVIYGSYMGGDKAQEHVDGGTSRFNKNGVVYQSVCGGCGGNSDFPTSANAWSQTNLSTNCNNLVFKFDFELASTPKFSISSDSTCQNSLLSLTNTSIAYDHFYWDFGNGKIDSTRMIIDTIFQNPGTYKIDLLIKNDVCNLLEKTSNTITVLENKIQVEKPTDFSFCTPITNQFTGNSFGTATGFIWSTSPAFSDTLNTNTKDSILNYLVSNSQKIYLKAFDPFCFDTTSSNLTIFNTDLALSAKDLLCTNYIDTATATLSNVNENFSLVWNPSDKIISSLSSNEKIIQSDISYTLHVKATGDKGCELEDSIIIDIQPPTFSAVEASASSYKAFIDDEIQLYAKPDGLFYKWSPIDSFPNYSEQNQTIKIKDSTLYTLEVNDGVCYATDTVYIQLITNWKCDFPYVFVPNAFSPNGDNENDILYVRGHPISKIEFRVYNRWGQMVFESFDINHGWDGTFHGELLDPAVFDYYLLVECSGGLKNQIQGNITLLR